MQERGRRRVLTGYVVSDKMDKTVVVAVQDVRRHPVYGRRIKNVRRFKAHDEGNQCQVGDRVSIVESRPLSREKRWRILEIIEKGAGAK